MKTLTAKTLTVKQLNIIRRSLASSREVLEMNISAYKLSGEHWEEALKNTQLDLKDMDRVIAMFEAKPKVIIKHESRKTKRY